MSNPAFSIFVSSFFWRLDTLPVA